MERPNLYEYFDYRKFLRDFISYKKIHQNGYSLNVMLRNTEGMKRSHLSLIINDKRNLTLDKASILGQVMNFDEEEYQYFINLVQYNQAKENETKFHFINHLIRHQKTSENQNKITFKLFCNWKSMAILELTRLDSFEFDYQWISSKFQKLISPEEAREIINNLIKFDLLEMNSAGRLQPTRNKFATSDEIYSFAVQNYHRSCLDLGKEKLIQLDLDKREFASLFMAIDEQKIGAVKEQIRSFIKQISEDNDSTKKGDLGLLNIQFFKLTDSEASDTKLN